MKSPEQIKSRSLDEIKTGLVAQRERLATAMEIAESLLALDSTRDIVSQKYSNRDVLLSEGLTTEAE
jgi:hypothetical protein